MGFSIKRKIDNLGRIAIPKEFRKLYHLDENEHICLVGTEEGVLLTNPNYKVADSELKK